MQLMQLHCWDDMSYGREEFGACDGAITQAQQPWPCWGGFVVPDERMKFVHSWMNTVVGSLVSRLEASHFKVTKV